MGYTRPKRVASTPQRVDRSGKSFGARSGDDIVAVVGSGTPSGEFSVNRFLPQIFFYVAVLPPYRVCMVWVFERTRSLLVAMLMHASLTGFVLFILMPLNTTGLPLLAWYAVFALALWSIVAAIEATPVRRAPAPRG